MDGIILLSLFNKRNISRMEIKSSHSNCLMVKKIIIIIVPIKTTKLKQNFKMKTLTGNETF